MKSSVVTRARTRRALGAAAALALGLVGIVAAQAPAQAATTGSGPWVVSVGDSFISGEAGRWAGSSDTSPNLTDALGPTAYDDAGTSESIPGCHRSSSAEIHIGGGVNSLNLACSGATTTTSASGSTFKPGIDFSSTSAGVGQALALQQFASSHDVRMVVLSIGGNDFGFASILTSCVTDWLLSPSIFKNYCYDDSSVTSQFAASTVASRTTAIAGAITNVRTAMQRAGYADSRYTILVQDYPDPIPPSSAMRYGQTGYTRQAVGGCGFWDADVDWMNSTALTTIDGSVRNAVKQTGLKNVKLLELQHAFDGHRLCEKGVGLIEEEGLTSWRQAGAVDKSEWINQIRTVTTLAGPYQIQESAHPNYWGQLALRSCVRQAFNGGAVRGGTCSIAGTGLTSLGEPRMTLS